MRQPQPPTGYNVSRVTDLSALEQDDLAAVVQGILNCLELDVWINETPDYNEIILTARSGSALGRLS